MEAYPTEPLDFFLEPMEEHNNLLLTVMVPALWLSELGPMQKEEELPIIAYLEV
jgi:hypothetical protein